MKLMTKLIALLSPLILLSSCATTTEKAMNKIEVGMDKAQVLDIAGDPQSTDRKDSHDEWTYLYYVGKKKEYTKVTFKNSMVTKIEDFDPTNDNYDNSYSEFKDKVKQKRKTKKELFKNIED